MGKYNQDHWRHGLLLSINLHYFSMLNIQTMVEMSYISYLILLLHWTFSRSDCGCFQKAHGIRTVGFCPLKRERFIWPFKHRWVLLLDFFTYTWPDITWPAGAKYIALVIYLAQPEQAWAQRSLINPWNLCHRSEVVMETGFTHVVLCLVFTSRESCPSLFSVQLLCCCSTAT